MENKVLNIAVIGCSGMASSHMRGVVNKEGAKLYAICDPAEERLAQRKEEYGVEIAVADYRELVNDPNVDAAIVVVPDKLHLPITRAFLEAGKSVLCEKPMALTVEECEEMMRVEKETGNKLMIGQVCRCTPAFRIAKDLVETGRIGELVFVESEYAHNYAVARGYQDWRVDPDRHGFIGGGCHAVDLLRWIAGDPTEVYAHANHKILTDWPVDDTSIAIYRFPNNVMGKVFVSIGCRRNYTMRTVLYGTKGTIICDNTSDHLQLFEDDKDNSKDYTVPQIIPVDINNHNVGAEIDQFVDALLKGEDVPISSIEGASTVAVCAAIVESARIGKPVEIRYPKV